MALPPQKIRLDSIKRIRLELASLYRDARAGNVPASDAARFAFILDRIRQCLANHELVERVETLEKRSHAR